MADEAPPCPNCAKNEGRIAELEKTVKDLERLVRDLTKRLQRTSSNSSIPPSSDWMRVVKPKPPTGRHRGGQPGHDGVTRTAFLPAEVDRVLRFYPERCRGCRHPLDGRSRMVEAHQVSEVPSNPAEVTEYRRYRRDCPSCGLETTAEFPKTVPPFCVGPRLQAVLTSLTGRYRLSRREACQAAEAIYGPKARIALGTMSALEARTSRALEQAYTEALLAVRRMPVVHADETSWMQDRDRAWLWTGATERLSVFSVHPNRNLAAYHKLMGEDFRGVLSTDRWSSYRGHRPLKRQLCWAHLKRNFQSLTEQWHKGATHIGNQGLLAEKAVTGAWRGYQEGRVAHQSLRVLLHPVRKRLHTVLMKGTHSTEWKTRALSRDVLKGFTSLWTFTRKPGVEPTNNLAERTLRKAVLWRKGSFGSDSARGSRFAERMLTASASLHAQGRSLVDFVEEAIRAHRLGRPHPSLLPG